MSFIWNVYPSNTHHQNFPLRRSLTCVRHIIINQQLQYICYLSDNDINSWYGILLFLARHFIKTIHFLWLSDSFLCVRKIILKLFLELPNNQSILSFPMKTTKKRYIIFFWIAILQLLIHSFCLDSYQNLIKFWFFFVILII